MEYALNLLEKLVAFNTDSDKKLNYTKCADFIEREAKKIGLNVKRIEAKAKDKLPRPNLIIELNKKAKKTLLLVAHYDVVAAGKGWKTEPFKLTRKGKWFYGRGTNDDKAAIATALAAMKELKEKKCKRNLKLVVACDEEVGGEYGLKYLSEKHAKLLKADQCIVMDLGLKFIALGCSGIGMGYLNFQGKQGHAAYPFKIPNILHKAIPLLSELIKEYSAKREKKVSRANAPYFAPKKKVWGRFSVTMLEAGYKTNIIPGELKVGFDIRAIPEEDVRKVMNEFKELVKRKAKKFNAKVGIEIKGSNGYFIGESNPLVRELKQATKKLTGNEFKAAASLGGTDARFIYNLGIPVVSFTPGGKHPHAPNECISLKELKLTKKLVIELAEEK